MAVWVFKALCFPWEENFPPFIERVLKEKEDLHENRVLLCYRGHLLTQGRGKCWQLCHSACCSPSGTLIPETNSSFCLSHSMGPKQQGPSLASESFYALLFRLRAQELLKCCSWDGHDTQRDSASFLFIITTCCLLYTPQSLHFIHWLQ